jgi:tetratricopeptide (TPR) repeat protein
MLRRFGIICLLVPVILLMADAAEPLSPPEPSKEKEPGPKISIPPAPSQSSTLKNATNQLQTDRKTFKEDRDLLNAELKSNLDATSAEKAMLRQKLDELLKKMNEPRPAPTKNHEDPKHHEMPVKAKSPPKHSDPTNHADPHHSEDGPQKPVDAIRAAQNYYRSKDYQAALTTLQLVPPSSFTQEDRSFSKYIMGCCYRQMGKHDQAKNMYREVLDSSDDLFLKDCARWQLQSITGRIELEDQIAKLRARRNSE